MRHRRHAQAEWRVVVGGHKEPLDKVNSGIAAWLDRRLLVWGRNLERQHADVDNLLEQKVLDHGDRILQTGVVAAACELCPYAFEKIIAAYKEKG